MCLLFCMLRRILWKSVKKFCFLFFQKNADVSIFAEIQGLLSRKKYLATPIFLCGFQ